MLNFARLRVPFILGSLILVLTIILKYTSLSQAQDRRGADAAIS